MSAQLPHIAVLMTAHNRRELTVRALRSLAESPKVFELTIVLLDDASKDGTAEAARAAWPGAIVLPGDGNAYWNGGMYQAWTHALKLEVDGYLWLNDDVELDKDALSRLANEWTFRGGGDAPFILVGPTRDDAGEVSYGGQSLKPSPFALRFERLPIVEVPTRADTFNGNIVLVSRQTQKQIGLNDCAFLHTLGDIDYGLRASAAGIPVLVMPGTLGICNNNVHNPNMSRSLRERFRSITSPRGIPIPNWWRITRRHSGIWMPLHFLLPYRKVLFARRGSHKPNVRDGAGAGK